jgi:hypothetical protein
MSPASDEVLHGGAGPAPPAPPGQVWDDWPPSTSPLLTEFPGKAELSWSLTGRRASVYGTALGVATIETDGRRIASEIELTVDGQPPETVAVRLAPDEVVRVLQAGEIQLTERVTTALDHPLIFWSILADAPVSLRLRWRADVPGAGDATLITELRHDGLLVTGREGDSISTGTLAAAGTVRVVDDLLEAEGDRLLRLVLIGGRDSHEVDTGLDALRRRKLRAFRQDRILHARRLEERLVSLESPDPTLDRRFGWAKVELDGRLEERPGRGRFVSRDALRTGRALLAAGDREVVLDLIRALGNRGAEEPGDHALPGLVDSYLCWTGDLAPVSRIWDAVVRAAEQGADHLATRVRDRLAAAARAAGEADFAARLEAIAATGAADPAPRIELTGYGAEPAGLVSGVVETLWGVEPDLIRGEVRVAPALPRGWTEMALRRLRVGPTFFDLRLRRRPERTVLTVRRSNGPPIRLRTSLREDTARGPVTIDQVELGGREATFMVEDVHEVEFHDG